MRKELYRALKERLKLLCRNESGEYYMASADMDADLRMPVIKHIDLWNRNVEFMDQEIPWERPAVFIEFSPVRWNTIVPGVEYRAEPQVIFHIVTDWAETTRDDEPSGIDMLDLPDYVHEAIAGLEGRTFRDMSLAESHTNHNHDEIVENIEIYDYVAFRSAGV